MPAMLQENDFSRVLRKEDNSEKYWIRRIAIR